MSFPAQFFHVFSRFLSYLIRTSIQLLLKLVQSDFSLNFIEKNSAKLEKDANKIFVCFFLVTFLEIGVCLLGFIFIDAHKNFDGFFSVTFLATGVFSLGFILIEFVNFHIMALILIVCLCVS